MVWVGGCEGPKISEYFSERLAIGRLAVTGMALGGNSTAKYRYSREWYTGMIGLTKLSYAFFAPMVMSFASFSR